jgi:hypothetical protein
MHIYIGTSEHIYRDDPVVVDSMHLLHIYIVVCEQYEDTYTLHICICVYVCVYVSAANMRAGSSRPRE